jgi:hypothetical protein
MESREKMAKSDIYFHVCQEEEGKESSVSYLQCKKRSNTAMPLFSSHFPSTMPIIPSLPPTVLINIPSPKRKYLYNREN